MDLKSSIRDIPHFPKHGVIFKDITTLLNDNRCFRYAVSEMVEHFKDERIDKVVSAESRGFIFGSVIAHKLHAGFVPLRKPGKLPHETIREEYETEYSKDAFEIHRDAIKEGENVLIVDDLLATGGTMEAATKLVERLGGNIVGIAILIELGFLKGRDRLTKYEVFTLVNYEEEE
ncbi:MAG: adenine phosphoribosyltransferase [Candidatus Aenigmarchaeota archaeon]|nr:adenine phosphoribosyltransferase [Candidatus Aenigmarchaeota archaeon]NIP40685.1 adenine phosphoribosyltransferase [Candidatus Aenigmarchaeota archaeon]NIQ18491.1 adenine phosphoribosyltransferase [Candidatus Aenigmarchaeota archaeon]NIS73390.1 adenine phosphoribosyltransferase [Candidatus Aenigmarchaeota archaeon]